MKEQPPKYAARFLRWYCREDFIDEIEGDLIELFEYRYKETPRRANWLFIWQVLLHFRPDFIRSFSSAPTIHKAMFKNYFKVAWRNILKHKLYAVINIGGLTAGLSAFLLLISYVQHELSFDLFHKQAEEVFRIYKKKEGASFLGQNTSAPTPAGLAAVLTQEFPEVTHASAFVDQSALLGFKAENYLENGLRADSAFFNIFSVSFLEGGPSTALRHLNSIVLTESLAKKIFGNENATGQILTHPNGITYEVSAVMKDWPSNSSIQPSFITNIHSFADYIRDRNFAERWNSNSFHTFFRLSEAADVLAFEDKLPSLLKKYRGEQDASATQITYHVQPLSEWHLETQLNDDIGQKGNAKYIKLFSLVALLILLLACINYVNLAIARSINRGKEVGLRKVIGAKRKQLIVQFIGESVLITFLALFMTIGLVYYLSPLFSDLLNLPIDLSLFKNIYLYPGLLLLGILVGVISGSYPAFYLSSIRPSQALKGKIKGATAILGKQRPLMIAQYATSIILIISSLVIYDQFQFINNKDLGYDREHIVTIPILDNKIHENIDLLKNEYLSHGNIISLSRSSSLPTAVDAARKINYDYDKGGEQEGSLKVYRARVDRDYLDVFSIELLAGRNFSSISTDTTPVRGRIINETAAKALGWTATEAIGKSFKDLGEEAKVIGVVQDFHMHSMHLAIAPLMLTPNQQSGGFLSVKVRPENLSATISQLEKGIKQFSAYPFDYSFLDEEFNTLYQADLRSGRLLGFFTIISVLIASLGLFGMAAFVIVGRTKEIGIRKILGASVTNIIGMLFKDFMKIILYGFLIASPIAWYVMTQWLHGFAYRVEISWWVFIIAGGIASFIAFFTVYSQSLSVAWVNPINTMKNE